MLKRSCSRRSALPASQTMVLYSPARLKSKSRAGITRRIDVAVELRHLFHCRHTRIVVRGTRCERLLRHELAQAHELLLVDPELLRRGHFQVHVQLHEALDQLGTGRIVALIRCSEAHDTGTIRVL